MTEEREDYIFAMVKQGHIRGVTRDEITELEEKYNERCSNVSCGGCLMNFVNKCIKLKENKNERK